MVVNIGDFGMSRDVYSTDYYKVTVLDVHTDKTVSLYVQVILNVSTRRCFHVIII